MIVLRWLVASVSFFIANFFIRKLNLHHDIFFFLILILVFVSRMLVRALWHFHYQTNPIPQRIVHRTTIEILRTIFPSIIPMFIAMLFVYYFMELSFFFDFAECSGQGEEAPSGSGSGHDARSREHAESLSFWKNEIKGKLRSLLQTQKKHIPRGKSIEDLVDSVNEGNNSSIMSLFLFGDDLTKKGVESDFYKSSISIIDNWRSQP